MGRTVALTTLLLLLAMAPLSQAREPGAVPQHRYPPGHRGYFGEIYFAHLLANGSFPQLCYSGPWREGRLDERLYQSNLPAAPSNVIASTRPLSRPRFLVRDLDGHCFERKVDQRGNELMEELPATDCVWTRIGQTR